MSREPQKRLGRGLSALFGDDAAAPASGNESGVQTLAVDLLEPSPFQPRREMDETALQELADSITNRGILQPLLVRPKPGDTGHYQIIAGERRWRAAQLARLHEVPVLVRGLSDADAMAAGLVENLQREDLNAIEEAEGYQRLIVEFKLTHDTLGEAVGKSRAHISNVLRLLKLPDKVLKMVRAGELSTGHAKALLSHAHPEKGAKDIVLRQLTVRQAEELFSNLGRSIPDRAQTPNAKGYPDRNADIIALETDLSERLGLKVKVINVGRKGTMTLHYDNFDQLDSVLKLLMG
jgi:ParB family chromosome partitioning protein